MEKEWNFTKHFIENTIHIQIFELFFFIKTRLNINGYQIEIYLEVFDAKNQYYEKKIEEKLYNEPKK